LLTALSQPFTSKRDSAKFREAAERTLIGDRGTIALPEQSSVAAAEIKSVSDILLPIIGPVARPLVARVARNSVGRDDFYTRLARELPAKADPRLLDHLRSLPDPRDKH